MSVLLTSADSGPGSMFPLLLSSISAHSSQVGFRWRCREGGEPHISPIDRATEISVYFTLVGYKQIHAWECLTITNYGNYSLLLTAFMFLSLCCMFYWSSLNLTALSRSYYHGWLVNGEGGLDRWSIWKVGVKEGSTHTVCVFGPQALPPTSCLFMPCLALPCPFLPCLASSYHPYLCSSGISLFWNHWKEENLNLRGRIVSLGNYMCMRVYMCVCKCVCV